MLREPVSGALVAIDDGLVDLITLLWDAEIATAQCCQGGVGSRAYITFGSVEDYDRFLRLVSADDGEEPTPATLTGATNVGGWRVQLRSYPTGQVRDDGTAVLLHTPSVYFSYRYVPVLTRRAVDAAGAPRA